MRAVKLLVLMLLLPLSVQAQKTYTLQGKITDSETGEALPGVTVMLKGTYYGAASDPDGLYKVQNVKEGTYTLEISLIGYKVMQRTGFAVNDNSKLANDFKLQPSVLTLGTDIVVIGEKPMLDIESTESKKTIGSQEIENSVIEDVTDLIRNQPGVVAEKNEIHIRGGRSYENSYLIDGLSIQDPFSGGTSGLTLSANSIEEVEVLTGGFNAEYGQSMSGVIEVKTKKGSEKLKGQFTYKSDKLGFLSATDWNSDVGEASLSGPLPFTSKKGSFFMSGYSQLSDTYLPHSHNLYSSIFGGTKYAPRGSNNYSGLFKAIYEFTPTRRLIFSLSGSANIDQGFSANEFENPAGDYNSYPYQYQYNLNNYNTQTRLSNQSSFTWSHTLSPKFFYELRLSRFFTQFRSEVGKEHWTEYQAPIDMIPINYFPITEPNYHGGLDTVAYSVTNGDGFYDYGDGDTWQDHYFEQYTFKADATRSLGKGHLVKSGIEHNSQTMQMVDINNPWAGQTGLGLNHDIYKVYPSSGAWYIQDKMSSFGLIINAGLRLDWWFPGKYVDRAVQDTFIVSPGLQQSYYRNTFKLFGLHGKSHLSPRLGISHPILDNAMLFYSYGHFSKLPKPQRVYAKLNSISQSTYQLFGNPDLNPETTVSYELGLRYEVTTNDVLTVTAYYRDIFDYIAALKITTVGRTSSQSYLMYFNLDYARSRGLELEYKKRAGSFFVGDITTSYSIATGKSSSPKDELLVARGQLEERSIKENYLSWDRPFRIALDLNLFAGKKDHHQLFGLSLPSDWDLYLRGFLQSGRRYTTYTRIDRVGEQDQYIANNKNPYAGISQSWHWVDFSFKKHFRFSAMKLSYFLEVTNLFNDKNSDIINPLTGKAYEMGDPVLDTWNDPLDPDPSPLSPFPFNPARYLSPRNIKMGVSFSW